MTRKVCVVTGTRAEFGLLRWLMHDIKLSRNLVLQIVATGAHLSPEHGLTVHEIEAAGFTVDRKVQMLLSSDSEVGITKSIGLGTIGFADAYNDLRPDLIVVLGDRYELISAVTAALIARIPVAHLHGGETTEGAYDESIRHAITKMAHLHFVAAEEYLRRVVQLGEQPDRVFQVGGLGVDAIKRMNLLSRDELERALDFRFREKNLLVTFHPATLDGDRPAEQFSELLTALEPLTETCLIFSLPNSDTGGKSIAAMIERFVQRHPNAHLFKSLGQLNYLSCMQFVDGVVGNSSSGLTEAPSMGVGTVNVGDRQKGRLSATSVIHCIAKARSILAAIETLYTSNFKNELRNVTNPYGNGGACEKIIRVLEAVPLEGILKKSFYDLPNADSAKSVAKSIHDFKYQ